MAEPLLRVEELVRHFGGVRAVDGVSFTVARGAVHGLIGPNGAGKTTVLNLISGLLTPTAGRVRLGETALERLPAHRVAAAGVRRTFQNIRLFPTLTALDNVLVGMHARRRYGAWARLAWLPAALREEAALRDQALTVLHRTGLDGKADMQARHLPYGEQRRLEIARALAAQPRLLLLDEPAAGMPHGELQSLITLIRAIAADGCTVVLIEHNMDLVMSVCDQLTVLDFGRVIADGPPAAVRADPAVIAAYLGADEPSPPAGAAAGGGSA